MNKEERERNGHGNNDYEVQLLVSSQPQENKTQFSLYIPSSFSLKLVQLSIIVIISAPFNIF